METTIPRADYAVGRLLWLLADPMSASTAHIDIPDDLLDTLGFTRRGIEKALNRLEAAGAVEWSRKRPGRPRVPYTTVTVDLRSPWWVETGVAA